MTKVGFVIPWYGETIPGGAESLCRTMVHRLKEAGLDVEVLCTCVKEFRSDWNENYFREGLEIVSGIPVRRFRVIRAKRNRFHQINRKLMDGKSVTSEEEKLFIEQMVRSDRLIDFMVRSQKEYVYVLLPYMFGTTYFGALSCPERSILIPCLHDEAYAYMDIYREMFQKVRGIVYNTPSEKLLAEKIFRISQERQVLGGLGIELTAPGNAGRFKEKYGLNRYILYAGRKDEGKNIGQLIQYFSAYKESFGGDLSLVLLGSGETQIPVKNRGVDIVDLGFVDAQDKWDAYSGAEFLCNPSLNESFSIVLMESWLAGRPVLVHEDCEVTRGHCQASQGGLYYRSFQDFVGCLEFFLSKPEKSQRMAWNGSAYVRANYSWPRVISKYQQAFEKWGFSV